MGTELDIWDVTSNHPLARSELQELSEELELLTHKVITCGVAATHPDPKVSTVGAYGGKWNSPQAEKVRELRQERDRFLVLATKHCPKDHHDWQEILKIVKGEKI